MAKKLVPKPQPKRGRGYQLPGAAGLKNGKEDLLDNGGKLRKK